MVWPFKKKKDEDNDKQETRKPSNSKFKQQQLPACQPILTAYTVLPLFFFIGVVFIPVGIGLLVSSNKVKEHVIEYSDDANCKLCDSVAFESTARAQESNCTCEIEFKLTSRWEGDVYFYYGLSNFYQNHRRYVRSRDDNQLHGTLSNTVNSDCDPFAKGSKNNQTIVYAPCGAIANSMFTDTFNLYYVDTSLNVPLTTYNITWKSDRETKFKNPENMHEFSKYIKPRNWFKNITELDDNSNNNGFINQDFIVWMRVAAFPTFRKLWRKLDREYTLKDFQDGLLAGTYKLTIKYNYPVSSFDGKKRFILSTASWLGGKNPFLGVAYIVVGCLCVVFGFVCLFIHMKVRTKPLMD